MTCEECIHKSVCYRVDSVQSDHAMKCGDFVSGCKALEQEPCDNRNEVMDFPETWEEYEEYYGFNDTEEVYSNNIRLIPSLRVKQWLDHLKTEPCDDATLKDIFCMGCEYKEQEPEIKEAYNRGYKDGQEALAYHLELCREEAEPCEDAMWSLKDVADALKRHGLLQRQEPCEDAISRQVAIDVVHEYFEKYLKLNDDICLDGIRSLPSVTPKQKMGHWIKVDDEEPIAYDCSECVAMVSRRYRFCPDCGAKMVNPQERWRTRNEQFTWV